MDIRLDSPADGATEPVALDVSHGLAAEAQTKAVELGAELQKRRMVLNMDQLASLISPRARFEQEFALPEPYQKCYFFSIDGVLNGRKIEGALFAGEVILVQAENFLAAQDLANRGLRSTVEIAHEEYNTRELRAEDSPIAKGLRDDLAGRKMRVSKPGEELASNPFLKSVIAAELGGLPWKF